MARRNERSPHRTGSGSYGGNRGRDDRAPHGRRDDYDHRGGRGGGEGRGDSYRSDDRHRTRSRTPPRRHDKDRRDDDRGGYSRNDRRDDRYERGGDRDRDRRPDLIRDRRRSRSPPPPPPRDDDRRSRESSYRQRERADSRPRSSRDLNRSSKPRAQDTAAKEAEEKAAKLAKLEAWKAKLAVKKREEESKNSTATILKDMDKKAALAKTPVLDAGPDAKAAALKRKIIEDRYKASGCSSYPHCCLHPCSASRWQARGFWLHRQSTAS
ncbi:hypothetical protein EJ08DRAFT_649205 [Tothia fuscella]|uniref:Uncharacterized protein n=1 Tax=Tothia fuscella TaxID=1048955 RepID=A0A9P4NTK1_9PEZI|nr:hypothetical protein EJ08DRAFT_649205 [Tothia fuscella]